MVWIRRPRGLPRRSAQRSVLPRRTRRRGTTGGLRTGDRAGAADARRVRRISQRVRTTRRCAHAVQILVRAEPADCRVCDSPRSASLELPPTWPTSAGGCSLGASDRSCSRAAGAPRVPGGSGGVSAGRRPCRKAGTARPRFARWFGAGPELGESAAAKYSIAGAWN